jgi:hypothetical protein
MIEESLLKSNYLGKDGFTWWLGQVAPANVWRNEKAEIDKEGSWAYRCKVRIIGYHTFDGNVLPDSDLPWAHVTADPALGAAQGGLGVSHNLAGGETVYGFFLDGEDAQQPVIIGCIYRNQNVSDLITPQAIQQEKSSQFKPFDGHQGRLIQGNTQRKPIPQGTLVAPTPPSSAPTVPTSAASPGETAEVDRDSQNNTGKNQLLKDDQASDMFAKYSHVVSKKENGCDTNPIGQITKAIQDFIALVNGIESYINTYIDPVLNTFVDMTYQIRRFTNIILGAVKYIINNMRDTIMKLVGTLFSKFVGLVIPIPQQPIVGEATKNILNIIFCLFEKLLDLLFDYLAGLLNGLVGNAINAPLCAAEEVTASILNRLMGLIEDLLAPVMSGLDWLMGGLSSVTSVLSQASSLANQILSFIGCDNLKCKTPSEWASNFGPKPGAADNWNRTLNRMNVLSGINNSLGSLSIFGSSSSPFTACRNSVTNPTSQSDLSPLPVGVRFPYCIPPQVVISGTGVNAQAYPIVANDGSILSIEILNGGSGFSQPPSVRIIDNSGYGNGAQAAAVITNGVVSEIYLTSSGSGYCQNNVGVITALPTYLVTANKYTFFEGETVTYTIQTTSVSNGTQLTYELTGVDSSDIQGGQLEGTLSIQSNSATVSVTVLQDSLNELSEEMRFYLYDGNQNAVALCIVIISNNLSPILAPEPPDAIQSPPGTVAISTGGNAGIGTTSGFLGIGTNPIGIITTGITTTAGPGVGITGITIGIGTTSIIGIGTSGPGFAYTGISTTGIITGISTGAGGISTTGIATGAVGGGGTFVGFTTIPTSIGIGTIIVGTVTKVVVTTPGYGYTTGDRLRVGGCEYQLVLTPRGSVIEVIPSTCNQTFDSLPVASINSKTGAGAQAYPVLKYRPQFIGSSGITVNQVGIVTVVDCV